MIKNCDNCRNCFVESDDSLICAVNCKPLPPSETCDDWEGSLIEELLRKARGETE